MNLLPKNVISAMELRREPGQLLDRVYYRNESFLVERAGKPKAVIVPLSEYEQILRYRREAKERLFERIDKLQKRTSQYDPEEVQDAIDEAVRSAQ